MTPPFVYNNQCSSVLFSSYIPVLLLGFSIQLLLTFLVPVLLYRAGELTSSLRDVAHGVLWPEYWLNSDSSEHARKKSDRLEKKPTIVLYPTNIICFDILNNLVIMFTFGLSSPLVAVAVTCTVASKMSVLLLLVGRFSAVLNTNNESGVHFALATLGKLRFPLWEVLQQSFWLLVWTSALFFSVVCWDIAGDDVGWFDSIWVPITTLSCPILLLALEKWMKRSRLGRGIGPDRVEKCGRGAMEMATAMATSDDHSMTTVENPIQSSS